MNVNNFRGLLVLFVLVLLFYSGTSIVADEGDAEGNAEAGTSSDTPVPYEREEFPEWAHDLRRAEIIFIGSFPITFLFSSLGYDVIRFAANGFSREYAPALLNNPTTVPLSSGERLGVVLTSLGISAVIALVDFIIGTGEE